MSGHHDNSLTNGKKKNSFQNRHCQNQQTVDTDARCEDIVHRFLGLRIIEKKVNINRFFHQIKGMTHNLGGKDAKKIRNNGKNDTKN